MDSSILRGDNGNKRIHVGNARGNATSQRADGLPNVPQQNGRTIFENIPNNGTYSNAVNGPPHGNSMDTRWNQNFVPLPPTFPLAQKRAMAPPAHVQPDQRIGAVPGNHATPAWFQNDTTGGGNY